MNAEEREREREQRKRLIKRKKPRHPRQQPNHRANRVFVIIVRLAVQAINIDDLK